MTGQLLLCLEYSILSLQDLPVYLASILSKYILCRIVYLSLTPLLSTIVYVFLARIQSDVLGRNWGSGAGQPSSAPGIEQRLHLL